MVDNYPLIPVFRGELIYRAGKVLGIRKILPCDFNVLLFPFINCCQVEHYRILNIPQNELLSNKMRNSPDAPEALLPEIIRNPVFHFPKRRIDALFQFLLPQLNISHYYCEFISDQIPDFNPLISPLRLPQINIARIKGLQQLNISLPYLNTLSRNFSLVLHPRKPNPFPACVQRPCNSPERVCGINIEFLHLKDQLVFPNPFINKRCRPFFIKRFFLRISKNPNFTNFILGRNLLHNEISNALPQNSANSRSGSRIMGYCAQNITSFLLELLQ